jgi:beta-lactamase regulating signal transducer with metallopeptidase domain/peptidoglycan hydrolase CwlO-like protein
MTLLGSIPASMLTGLAVSALRALALSGLAGCGLAAFRAKSNSARLFTWTAVLYAALAMPLLEWMLPAVSVPTPAVLRYTLLQSLAAPNSLAANGVSGLSEKAEPASSAFPATGAWSSSHAGGKTPIPDAKPMVASRTDSPSYLSSIQRRLHWSTVAAGTYFIVTLILLMRFSVGLAFGRRLVRASQKIEESRLALKLASRSHAWGLVSTPQVAESEFISVPLTTGVLHSTILLPFGWREWDDATLDAVVAHEVSHVARRDALTQRVSLLHRAIFWFSPLAWWLDRHLADLAEQASDEAVLTSGANRKDYARTLLGFFATLQATPGRVWWQGVSMAKAGQAEQRVERILSWKGSVAMHLNKSIALTVLALAVPVVYLVASVHAANPAADGQHLHVYQEQTPSPSPRVSSSPTAQAEDAPQPADPLTDAAPQSEPTPQSEPSPAPAAIAGTISGTVYGAPPTLAPVAPLAPKTSARSYAPVTPIAPLSPMPPAAVWSAQSGSSSSSSGGFSYAYGYDDEQRFVIVSGKTDSLTMSGTTEDARHVEKLRKQIPGDFIWFQRDEKSYIIRDQATIDRARKLWAPQEELGKKQEALGKQQEALGKQQEALGDKMGQIHVSVPDMTAELDKLKAELKQLNASATMEQVGHIQSEIGELQSRIGELQSRAGDQQGKLGEQMGALGEKQGKLGEEQGELGRQQGELAREASRQMTKLFDDAIAKGIAQLEL